MMESTYTCAATCVHTLDVTCFAGQLSLRLVSGPIMTNLLLFVTVADLSQLER